MNSQELKLIKQLEGLKQIKADSVYLKSFKNVLENRITLDQKTKPVLFWNVLRFSLSFSLFLIIATGLGFGVVKATESIPANTFFYPVKLVTEKLQLGFQTFNVEPRVDLRLKFASNRIKEASLLESSEKVSPEMIKSLMAGYVQEIFNIQSEVLAIDSASGADSLKDLLGLEKNLLDISLSLTELSRKSSNTESYAVAIEASDFLKNFLSRRVYSLEIQLQTFEGDLRVKDRLATEFSSLESRRQKLEPVLKDNLATLWGTRAVDLSESTQRIDDEIFKEWKELSGDMGQWKTEFDLIVQPGKKEVSLDLLNSLVKIEKNLAEIEVLLK